MVFRFLLTDYPVSSGYPTLMSTQPHPMILALAQARLAARAGEVPVGAVLTGPDGAVLAAAYNLVETRNDPTAHAEVLAIRAAAEILGTPRLVDCALYVTLEPCAMCAQAISLARIRRLYFAAYDPKGGGVEHGARVYSHATCHHAPEVYGGMHEGEAAALLKRFFGEQR
jgi:tRNA(Arg) A34 adenosine deaminase TadA